MRQNIAVWFGGALLAWGIFAGASIPSAQGQGNAEWTTYAGNKLAHKYSPLDQINKDNVRNLRIAWRQSVMPPELRQLRPDAPLQSELQNTPLMIGGLLYVKTSLNNIAALDAATGKLVWFDTPPPAPNGPGNVRPSRGLAYWTDGTDARIIGVTGQQLIAVNAKTGKRYPGFGDGGQVDLAAGYDVRPTTPVGGFRWTSHPIVVRDVIVVGGVPSLAVTGANAAGLARRESPPGDIRGYDVRTGQRLWTFHVVPRAGEVGSDTWLKDSAVYSGSAGTWSWMSADEELGYVYIPTEHANSDYFGGSRPGANLFADSVLCLDATTGRRIWHFQTMHHGIWDWDQPTAPILADITVDGRRIKAAVQLTKTAFAFVLDRETGRPVWPIEERLVPSGDVPGEWYPPTQPFPTKPPALDMQGLTNDDLIDFTPELRRQALEIVSKYTHGPLYTQPSIRRGIIQNPGDAGGPNWNGGAFDPETGMLYVPTTRLPIVVELVPPSNAQSSLAYVRRDVTLAANLQLPIDGGLPIVKPPYGSIVAIDLNKGDIAWRVPNGNGPRNHPALRGLNLPPLGTLGRPSPLLTKTLLFIGEGLGLGSARVPAYGGGKMFRAYDKKTGQVVWETELPGGTTSAPMTYTISGRQYIVVAVGWDGMPAEWIALTLP